MRLKDIFSKRAPPVTAAEAGPKYELLRNETRTRFGGPTVYRIRALRDFGKVKAGDRGGFVQSEANLSHDGNCWVADNAEVFENARVLDNAIVSDRALVFGNAKIFDNARVLGTARVSAWAEVPRHETIKGGELQWPVKTRWQYFKSECKRCWQEDILGW